MTSYYDKSHIFTSREKNGEVTIKAGSGENLIIEGTIIGDHSGLNLIENNVLIGNSSNKAEGKLITGPDATLSNDGITLTDIITPGSFTSADITVDSKGRITNISNGSTALTTSLLDSNILIGNSSNIAQSHPITGSVVLNNDGSTTLSSLITPDTYQVPTAITVNAEGRITNTDNSLLEGFVITGDSFGKAAKRLLQGDIVINNLGVATLQNTTVTPGIYNIPTSITTNEKGRITDITDTGTSGQVAIVNSSNKLVPQSVTGDATISSSGALTLTSVTTASTCRVPSSITVNSKGQITAIDDTVPSDGYFVATSSSNKLTPYLMGGDAYLTGSSLILNASGVTAGSYSNPVISVNAKGQITSAANGSNPLTDGHIYVGNVSNVATDISVSGDISLTNTGTTSVNKIKGALLGTIANTTNAILVSDGTNFNSKVVSGDATISSLGVLGLTAYIPAINTGTWLYPSININEKGICVDVNDQLCANGKILTSDGSGFVNQMPVLGDLTLTSSVTGANFQLASITTAGNGMGYANQINYDAKGRVTSLTPQTTILMPIASAATPSFSFTGRTNTGLFSPSSNQLGLAAGGVQRLLINGTTAIEASTPYRNLGGTATLPTYSFIAETDSGFFRDSAGLPCLSASTAKIIRMKAPTDGFSTVQIGPPLTNLNNGCNDSFGESLTIYNNGMALRTNIGIYKNGTNTSYAMAFYNNSSSSTQLVGNITMGASSTSYNTTSDYRLKENIEELDNGFERILAIKPVKYTWKTSGDPGEGFIASELQEHFPLAVTGEKDEMDIDGREKWQSIDVSFLTGALVHSVQCLSKENDELRNSLKLLASRVSNLEGL